MIIALTGYMGSGKSTIGYLVAEKLNMPFIDLDEYIEKNFGFKPGDLIRVFGEEFFRKIERQALKFILEKYPDQDIIIALGGGTFVQAENKALLQQKALNVFIDTPFEKILSNIKNNEGIRPLLIKNKKKELDRSAIHAHYNQRLAHYRQADIIFNNHYDKIPHAAHVLYDILKPYIS